MTIKISPIYCMMAKSIPVENRGFGHQQQLGCLQAHAALGRDPAQACCHVQGRGPLAAQPSLRLTVLQQQVQNFQLACVRRLHQLSMGFMFMIGTARSRCPKPR